MNFKKPQLLLLIAVALLILFVPELSRAQKVAFIVSDVIRERFQESKAADQRIRSIVEEWKRELDAMEKQIDDLQFEIKKNRLVWSDEERATKEKELEDVRTQRMAFARKKFESHGEYDTLVKQMMAPVEDKIYAAVQEVAVDEGYDMIWDKSVQPLPYTNSKYDATVKVLKKLGVDVDKLEKELQEKIDKDPRNAKKDTKAPPGKRTKSRDKNAPQQGRDIEREPDKDQQNPTGIKPPQDFNKPDMHNPPPMPSDTLKR